MTLEPNHRNYFRRLLAVALVGLLGVACGGGSGESDSPTSLGVVTIAEIEYTSFDLANSERSNNGIQPPLSFDEAVASAARNHSVAMRDQGFFSHNGPDGSLSARLHAAGVRFSSAGENIARLESTSNPAGLAHSYFVNSDEHREVMLEASFRLAGVGVARAGDTFWLTQIYIRP